VEASAIVGKYGHGDDDRSYHAAFEADGGVADLATVDILPAALVGRETENVGRRARPDGLDRRGRR
jgi:hypothetical protein